MVGVVDTGIWPGNPSFNGLADGTPGTAPGLPGFHGACAPAEEWSAEDCSDKVVSARWFVKGFGAENTAGAEYLSPRDGTGHGSHVASTAAGDHGVRVEIDGQRFGTTSGMAPAARLAVYKACWSAPDPSDDGCTTADTVAAVDAAVADGVDVLNYSVSGSTVRDDSVERAFLGAASAGVFVAASAGNGGPRPGSVRHVAPWVTTVAAGTHHLFQGAVRLGDGRSYVGAMVSDAAVRPTRLVLGADAAAPGADPRRRPALRVGRARRVEGAGRDRGVRARRRRPGRQVRGGGRLRRRRHGAGEPPAGEHRRRRARRPHRPPGRAGGRRGHRLRPPAGAAGRRSCRRRTARSGCRRSPGSRAAARWPVATSSSPT